MGKPQVLVRFEEGDHACFDVEGHEYVEVLKRQLNSPTDSWIHLGPYAVIKKEKLSRVFYFPEGYPNANSNNDEVPAV